MVNARAEVYAVVLPASPGQRAALSTLRARTHPQRRYVPAHVTVKGTFSTDLSVAHLRRILVPVAAATPPLVVVFTHDEEWADDGSFRVRMVQPSPALEQLHELLLDAFEPHTLSQYPYERDGSFRPHLTLYESVPPDRIARTAKLASRLDLGPGFVASRLDLVGRFGPRVVGPWRTLARAPLGTLPSR